MGIPSPEASSAADKRLLPKDSRDVVRQSAQDRDDDKARDHGDDVAAIVPARLGKHSAKKHTEKRAVGVAENPEHDRDDADIRDAR